MSVDYTPEQNSYKDLSSFRFWCQKVLPVVYDDSLSYYELLNKVVVYLNDTINNVNAMGADVTALYGAYVSLQGYVNHYFDNLDVQAEINNKLDAMAQDGSLSAIIQPLFDTYKVEINRVISEQNEVLRSGLESQNQVLRSGLESQNQVLRSGLESQNQVLSDTLELQDNEISVLNSRMNSFTALQQGSTTGDAELADGRVAYTGKTYPNIGSAIREQADGNHLFNVMLSNVSSTIQLFDKNTASQNKLILEDGRVIDFDGYYVSDYIPVISADYYVSSYDSGLTGGGGVAFDKNKIFVGLCSVGIVSNTARITPPVGSHYIRFTIKDPTTFQVFPFFRPRGYYDFGEIVSREQSYSNVNGVVKDYKKYETDGKINIDEMLEEGCYVLDDALDILGTLPAGLDFKPSLLYVTKNSLNFDIGFIGQTLGTISDYSQRWYRITNARGEFGKWTKPDGTTTNTYITNTYNVEANPNITSDTNNYLGSTHDNTDRSYDIASMLSASGVCNLGTGVFYVKNITVPEGCTVRGSGYGTKIILDNSDDAQYCFKLLSNSRIENMQITGSSVDIGVPSSVGTRHGVVFEGEASNANSNFNVKDAIIDSLWISNFTGGGITCRNTGYPAKNSMNVCNCIIHNCGVGINISYWSEYHRFTNINCYGCYRGCVNNGGNNMFVNCGFSQNILGFLMDNASGDAKNTAHGSAIGCMFNHSDSNNGVGIKVVNMNEGFVFNGCQMFYSGVELISASGIIISNTNFGNNNIINVENGGLVMFDGCMFGNAPAFNITNNNNVKVTNCYTRSGDAVNL